MPSPGRTALQQASEPGKHVLQHSFIHPLRLDNCPPFGIINNMKEKTFRYIEPIQIRFNDIDGQQHVNNGVYQQYYDIGRAGYFTTISGKEYQTGGQSVVVASVHTDFLIPIFLHDKIQLETRMDKIGNKSLTMEQRITGVETGEVKSICTTVFVGFDYEKQQTMEISAEMKTMIKNYEKDIN